MDIPATLAAISNLSVEDRLLIVEAIWGTIVETRDQPPLTAAQHEELQRRFAAHDADPHDVVSWEEVKAAALARVRK